MSTITKTQAVSKELAIHPIRMQKFIKKVTNPWLLWLFMLYKMPMGFIARLRVRTLDRQQATVSIPFGWLNQNPFRSTYFAALSMAAELSNGIIVLMAVDNSEQNVSTLPIAMESEFIKKATNLTTFTCTDGEKIFAAVEKAVATGEAVKVSANTVGCNEEGEVVARFTFHWSIKKKSSK